MRGADEQLQVVFRTHVPYDGEIQRALAPTIRMPLSFRPTASLFVARRGPVGRTIMIVDATGSVACEPCQPGGWPIWLSAVADGAARKAPSLRLPEA